MRGRIYSAIRLTSFAHGLRPGRKNEANALLSTLRSSDLVAQTRREYIEGHLVPYSTYIILCVNRKYYVGHSKDPDLRLTRHKAKDGAKFTKQNKPVKILWKQEFKTELEAIRREKQIKGWFRKKKENLINRIWE